MLVVTDSHDVIWNILFGDGDNSEIEGMSDEEGETSVKAEDIITQIFDVLD